MRYILTAAAFLLAVAFAFDHRPATARAGAAAPIPDLKISLAVQEDSAYLHIIIENTSNKPQRHFDEWNSWGYFNITLRWTDRDGKSGTVTKVPRGWDRNYPSTVTLPPGDMLVREVPLPSPAWQGWPDRGGILKVKATYHQQKSDDPGEPADPLVWVGSATSREQIVSIPPKPIKD